MTYSSETTGGDDTASGVARTEEGKATLLQADWGKVDTLAATTRVTLIEEIQTGINFQSFNMTILIGVSTQMFFSFSVAQKNVIYIENNKAHDFFIWKRGNILF